MGRRSSIISKVRETKRRGCLAYGFCAVFALAGSVSLFAFAIWPIYQILTARGWVETPCTILSSEVAVNRDSDGSATYRVAMTYAYRFDGLEYEGDRYDFSTGHSSGRRSKQRVVAGLPTGSEALCYVDPDVPSRSVINREPGGFLWWGLFPIPFLAFGFGGLYFLIRTPRLRTVEEPAERVEPPPPSSGALNLEPQHTPLVKFLAVLAFAAFWNTFVGFFLVTTIIPEIRRGDVDWFDLLFAIPFTLVGLVLIAITVYLLLTLANPRPRLTLESAHLTPGATTTLHWLLTGRATRLQQLTLSIEGREAATYRRGTKTQTDHHVFYRSDLLSGGGPTLGQTTVVGRQGAVTLKIPERTMPTFDAGNNKIEWRLQIHGDVPNWPDMQADFPITVYPPAR